MPLNAFADSYVGARQWQSQVPHEFHCSGELSEFWLGDTSLSDFQDYHLQTDCDSRIYDRGLLRLSSSRFRSCFLGPVEPPARYIEYIQARTVPHLYQASCPPRELFLLL